MDIYTYFVMSSGSISIMSWISIHDDIRNTHLMSTGRFTLANGSKKQVTKNRCLIRNNTLMNMAKRMYQVEATSKSNQSCQSCNCSAILLQFSSSIQVCLEG
jgi:hypothetical protein